MAAVKATAMAMAMAPGSVAGSASRLPPSP
jgi:hypothetical protein